MKAVIWTKYGAPDGLVLKEIEKPVLKDGEVMIKVHATTVVTGDCEMRALKLPLLLKLPIRIMNGLSAPKRMVLLGQEFAGEVVETGKLTTRFKPGDKVYGATGFGHGTYAEYICLPEALGDDVIMYKPESLSYEEAAAVPVGALEALHFLTKADIQPGETVLINGSAGSIGTFAIQFAKSLGAHVTAVDSKDKQGTMLSCGADSVIDYTKQDFTKGSKKYDVIFDVVGKASLSRNIRALNKNGRYLLANPTVSKMLGGLFIKIFSSKRVITGVSQRTGKDLDFLQNLIKEGVIKPVIDRNYSLEQMPEAHRYVDSGQKKGSVTITIASDK